MNIEKDDIYSFIFKVFEKTYSKFISREEINKRTSYIVDNFHTLPPLSIFKSILYSDTNNEVGKLAIDFRIRFISKDYEQVISSGESYEIDTFEDECKSELLDHIIQECSIINFEFLRKAANPSLNLETLYEEHKQISLKLQRVEKCSCRAQVIDSEAFWLNANEKCISAVYGINIMNGSKLSNESIELIESENRTRFNMFSKLKIKYPNLATSTFVHHHEFLG